MLLISLMLAAAPAPSAKPAIAPRREAARPAAYVFRSKRLIELEAVVRSLSSSAPEPARTAGPEGL